MATRISEQVKQLTQTWSKWDIALYVGAPLALGVAGFWFLRRGSKSASKKADKSGGDGPQMQAAPNKINSMSGGKSQQEIKLDRPQSRQDLAQAAKNKGNKFFKDGKYEEAIICYTEAIKTCPPEIKTDMSTFYQNRAAAYENQKSYKHVVEDCTAALQLNPRYSKALARRSKAYEVLEKYREALEDITKACLIEGFENQSYLQAADRVLKTLGKSRALSEYKNKKATQPSKFYVENYLAGFVNDPVALKFKSNDLTDLGIKFKHESDQIGDNGAVLLEKPSAFEQAKNCLVTQEYDQILALCDQELADETHSNKVPETLLLRGTMRLIQGIGDGALQDLSRLGNMEDVDKTLQATALIREGCLRVQRDTQDNPLSSFVKAETIDPENSDVYHHHGQQLLQLEKLDEAISKFDRSIQLSPNFPTSYVQKYYAVHRKAIVKEDLKLLTEAKAGFEQTITKFPNCSDALILYAQALSDQGLFDEAEVHFKKAQDVQPRNANNIVHRGLMLLQWKGSVEKTLELLEEALRVDPTCQYAYEIRGTIEVQRGNLTEAVNNFKKAISLSNSESEMAHLFSLMEAAEVQVKVAKDLNIQLPSAFM